MTHTRTESTPVLELMGPGRCLLIAEVAQAHDGSLGMAHAYIDAAARAGAGAIKFQTHIAAAESTAAEPWRVKFSTQDATRYDYWKRMEFSEEQWRELKRHAEEQRLLFLSSPFSFAAMELLQRLEIAMWKVGSGEVANTPFLRALAATRKPVLLSSGLSTFAELDAAVALVRAAGAPVALLQCTTRYPCPPEELGLNLIAEMAARYPGVPVGLSDHSATIAAGLAAVALGARLLEVHVCFSREQFGPDTGASLTIEELAQLARGVEFLRAALEHPVNKDAAAAAAAPMARIFGKSVVAARALHRGSVLDVDSLALKKPGTGIPAAQRDAVIGRRLRRDVQADEILTEDHLE